MQLLDANTLVPASDQRKALEECISTAVKRLKVGHIVHHKNNPSHAMRVDEVDEINMRVTCSWPHGLFMKSERFEYAEINMHRIRENDHNRISELNVWVCDEYTTFLARDREEANKLYLEYMRECHGQELKGIEAAEPEEFTVMDDATMDKWRFYPNEENDDERRFSDEYQKQIGIDPFTPRLFSVSE